MRCLPTPPSIPSAVPCGSTRWISGCAPPCLHRLANLDGGRLVYVVDAPVWRAKLRLAGPGILDAARSLGLGVSELVVKATNHPLHPPADPPQQANRKATPMSAAARDALQAALASLKKDPDTRDPEDS
jgi:hypothetical protein